MKRVILITLAALAALLTASCEKEANISAPVAKVPATLSVSVDDALTKTALGSDGLSILWEGTESLGVFDGIATAPNKFDAASAGATTSFTGEVSEGASSFIVFYPYQAEAVVSDAATSTIKVRMPAVQQAVKNGYDPAAGLAARVVTSLSDPVKLYNQFALLKVNVDQDGVTAITVSATNRKLAGGIALKVSTNGGSNGDAPTSNSVTLKNADDSALEQGFYYIAVRPSSTTSPYEGFAMEVVKNGVTKTRTASNDLVVARNHILSIGKVSTLFDEGGGEDPTPTYNGRYEAYMAYEDVVIGGKTYNRGTDGDATLLANGAVLKTGNTGVIFVASDAEITNTSEVTITGNVILASNDLDHPAKYTTSTKSFLLKSGSLVMDHLAVDMAAFASSGQFFTKKDNDGNFSSLNLEGCHFKNIKRPVYAPNSSYLNNGIESIRINGCIFATSAAVQLFSINSNATTLAGYKDFTFTNNVFYSTSGAAQSYVFATSAEGINASTCQQEVVMDNNLFYNIAASNGIFRTYALKSIYIRNNVLWAEDGTYSSNIKMFKANSGTDDNPSVFEGASSNNYCYGNLGSKKWSISDAACRGPLTNVTTLTETPIDTADTATGTFTLTSTYSAYGPQPMPIPM